ncbi:MAG: CusA/CzcA family heavy metal efflux RND transporter, partial [Acidobacteria bacterium]
AVAVLYGVYTLRHIPVDAIPDLSDTQVIVYSRWDRSPDIIEDQVTYPIVAALLGTPHVKVVRGFSDFGYSYVYVIFQDGTDLYWARSRVLEYLSKIQPLLPQGVTTELGPDATGVGWVFQYALIDETGRNSPADLRTLQDWNLRYRLQSVPGVAEVASFGGFVKQYQVTVDPNRLRSYGLSITDVADAVRKSNQEAGGRLLEMGGREFMVRGRGYVKQKEDLEAVVLKADATGTPVLVRDVAWVALGPEIRRGVSDFDGRGDVAGGVVVMRHGENARAVIDRVKERLEEIKPSLPEGVRIVTTYDRSDLIERAIDNLKHDLTVEIIIVSLVILVFLWHIPSAIVPIVTIPVSVLLAFIPMSLMGISSNIMSLAGIAISIGVLVDGAIVEVENAYKKLERWQSEGGHGDFHRVRLEALLEVGPSVFFSLLVIAVAFLPIFTLVDQEGRLFRPLAWTKNLTMFMAALLALTLDPALRMMFTRMHWTHFRPAWLSRTWNTLTVGRYYPEERHPISRTLFAVYEPACRFVLRHPKAVIGAALLVVLTTVPAYLALGHEFMPRLNEGTILYMPTTLPGISVAEATQWLQAQDRVLMTFPEVIQVHGKAGRAETSTDPAPLSMVETVVDLKPPSEWRSKDRWYSSWAPEWFKATVLRRVWPDHLSYEELVDEMDAAMKFPGTTNAWPMPIKNRIDMLTTGIRTPIGVKVFGPDLKKTEAVGEHVEEALRRVKGTRSVFAERVAGGYFLDFDLRRESLARYGLTVADAQAAIMAAVGGENVTTTIEGRARFPVNVRYPRELRDDLSRLGEVLVRTPTGAQVPIAQLAELRTVQGPSMVRNENGLLSGYVYVDTGESDIGGFVERAKEAVAASVKLEPGYSIEWSGQYENMLRVRQRLKLVLPVTIFLIAFLLYANTGSATKAGIVLLAVPFSVVGAVWLMWALGYNISIAAWVGMIALMGLDAETGVFMLLFLDLSYDEAKEKGLLRNRKDLEEAIVHGAVKRVRPKMMTVAAAFMGLMPIMWSTGTGADVMKRIAAPMVGGLATSFVMELLVYPAIYLLWKWNTEVKHLISGRMPAPHEGPVRPRPHFRGSRSLGGSSPRTHSDLP